MSHSSGIPVKESVKQAFAEARASNSQRLIKIQIVNDEIVEVAKKAPQGDWKQDLKLIDGLLDTSSACYILYHAEEWALFCYVPDGAKVKDKMIYASSRGNLKNQLGSNNIKDELFGTVASDFSLSGYEAFKAHKNAEAPLTEREVQKKNDRESGEVFTGGSTTYVHGVAFPVDPAVIQASKDLTDGKFNYLQVKIDSEKEKIVVDHTGSIGFQDLKAKVSTSDPRFHFFRYQHKHDGSSFNSTVFVYSCPDGTAKGSKPAPIKLRMLYSSSKANVSDIFTSQGFPINAKVEASGPDDIDEESVLDSLHPTKEDKSKNFARPKRVGKGGARLTRDAQVDE